MGNVYQCCLGHLLCNVCFFKIGGSKALCPTCSQQMSEIRVISLEKHRDRKLAEEKVASHTDTTKRHPRPMIYSTLEAAKRIIKESLNKKGNISNITIIMDKYPSPGWQTLLWSKCTGMSINTYQIILIAITTVIILGLALSDLSEFSKRSASGNHDDTTLSKALQMEIQIGQILDRGEFVGVPELYGPILVSFPVILLPFLFRLSESRACMILSCACSTFQRCFYNLVSHIIEYYIIIQK